MSTCTVKTHGVMPNGLHTYVVVPTIRECPGEYVKLTEAMKMAGTDPLTLYKMASELAINDSDLDAPQWPIIVTEEGNTLDEFETMFEAEPEEDEIDKIYLHSRYAKHLVPTAH